MKKICLFILESKPSVRFFNAFLLILFAVSLLLVHEIIQDPHILSVEKKQMFLLQKFWYFVLIRFLMLFNLWLILYPLVRLLALYGLLLKVEKEDFVLDLLFIFITLIFSFVVVHTVFYLDTYLATLTLQMHENTPDINVRDRIRTLILYGSEEAFKQSFITPLNSSSLQYEGPSDGDNGSSKILCVSPVKDNPSEPSEEGKQTENFGSKASKSCNKITKVLNIVLPPQTTTVGGPALKGGGVYWWGGS
jgi:hypothetical protein